MKGALLFFIAAALDSTSVLSSYARNPNIAETDYLIPVDGIIQSDFYALLSRKLFVTPANVARVVDLSSGDNEVVIAIYTDSRDGTQITYTRPDKLLWKVSRDGRIPQVSVTRIDVPIPRSLAIAVSAALNHLLSERRPPTPTEEVILDGRLIEFSIPGPRDQRIRGLLTNCMRGKKGQSLNRLTDLLERYCQASPVERAAVAVQISTEAAKSARYPVRGKAYH